jgi:hypothetical protein
MAIFHSSCDASSGDDEKMFDFFSPAQVDQSVRQAIQMCWMSLPKERKNAHEVEAQIRRLVDRALRDFHDDCEQFERRS